LRTLSHRFGRSFTFQWHLTLNCGYSCKHCYLDDPLTHALEKKAGGKTLLPQILGAIETFYIKMEQYTRGTVKKNIILTGGDPLLHPQYETLVSLLSGKSYNIGILGCPETFTGKKTALLRDHNIKSVQFSLDGLEDSHDRFRGVKGSFKRTIEKALELQEFCNLNIMFTVCKENMNELIPLINRLAKEGIKHIDFARNVFMGNASRMDSISPGDYKALLTGVHELEQELSQRNSQLKIGKKDNLWKLFYYEKGLLDVPGGKKVISGCPCGYTSLCILSDGSLFICRRFFSKIGDLPGDDIFAVFHNHETLCGMRNLKKYSGCGICRLRYICRGCPAVGASYYREMFHRDPQCWRIVMP
jgi:radical SAM protein with 4Fe4S-binding SPASM domain